MVRPSASTPRFSEKPPMLLGLDLRPTAGVETNSFSKNFTRLCHHYAESRFLSVQAGEGSRAEAGDSVDPIRFPENAPAQKSNCMSMTCGEKCAIFQQVDPGTVNLELQA